MKLVRPAGRTRFARAGTFALLAVGTFLFPSHPAWAIDPLPPLPVPPSQVTTTGTWIGDGGTDNWSDTAQWSGGTVPNAAGDVADLTNSTSSLLSDQVINLDIAVTLGVMNIGDINGAFKF